MSEALGNRSATANVLTNLADIAFYEGDFERAREHLRRALAVARKIGDPWGIAYVLYSLAETDHESGDQRAAENHASESLAGFRRIGHTPGVIACLTLQGKIACKQARFDRAGALLRDALRQAVSLGQTPLVLQALGQMAALRAARGELVGAVELAGAVAHHPPTTAEIQTDSREDAQNLLGELEPRLPAATFAAALEGGRSRPIDDWVRECLDM